MAANPGMCDENLLTENKRDVYGMIPEAYKPTTLYFEKGTDVNMVAKLVLINHIDYPLVIKPNIGARGRGVKILNNKQELFNAIFLFNTDFIIQPYIDYSEEIGLFFTRLPGEHLGSITGIVKKEFLSITGDGIHTCLQLLYQNPRYILQIDALKKSCGDTLDEILPKGKTQILMPYGNHSRGCLFTDYSHKIDLKLTYRINQISDTIQGFNYGRMDIRYNKWEDLLAGKNFSIIELNGAASEPTHMYDPKHSLLYAWKEIARHWTLLYRVSVASHSAGSQYPLFSNGWQRLKNTINYESALNKMKF